MVFGNSGTSESMPVYRQRSSLDRRIQDRITSRIGCDALAWIRPLLPGHSEANMKKRIANPGAAVLMGAALLTLPTHAAAQDINQKLMELRLGLVGLTIDMPDGQYVGESNADGTTFRWDAELTPDDRVSQDRLLGVEHFQWAGLPICPGNELSFTKGIFGPERFRLGGRLTSLNIQGRERYEVRSHVHWEIYDTETSSIIIEKDAKGTARGAVLGLRGEQPNALMDSVIDSLEGFLKKDGEKALKAARG